MLFRSVEALKAFWEQVQEREKMAAEIADDIFPVDFHIYAIKCPENCMMLIIKLSAPTFVKLF